jgi:hypothetical protein
MEMGNLSSREIEPDRAVAELFSHYGGGQQSRESGAEAVVEQAQHLAIALRRIRFDPIDLPMLLSEVSQATRVCFSLKTIGYRARPSFPARSWRPLHVGSREPADQAHRRACQATLSGPRPHAPPRLRLRSCKRRSRYTGVSGLAAPPQHHAYGALHRAVADEVQGFLAQLS